MTSNTPKNRWELIRESLLSQIRLGRMAPGDKLPSERDLAKELGVSHPTVHKALSSLAAEGIVIRQVGRGTFVTDAVRKRTGAIAMYFGKWANPFDDPILYRVCAGISRACAERGLDLFFHTPEDIRFSSPSDYLRSILDRGCDGLLCLGDVRGEVVEEAATCLPTVVVADHKPIDAAPRLVADQGAAVAAAVTHLASLGRERIALAGSSSSDYSAADDIVNDFRGALAGAGLEFDESLVSCTGPAVPGEHRFASDTASQYWFDARMFTGDSPPDAAIGINPGMGRSIFEYCLANNVSVPGDLALVSVMECHWAAHSRPGITTVDFLSEELGRQGIAMLEEAIEDGLEPGTVRRGSAPLIVRESCGAPPQMMTPVHADPMEVTR